MANRNILEFRNSQIQDIYSGYLARVTLIERRARSTVATYLTDIAVFLHWCVEEGLQVQKLTCEDLIRHFEWRRSEGISGRTVAKQMSALSAFGDYLVDKGIWAENIAKQIDRPKKTRPLPHVFSAGEVETLLARINTNTYEGMRNDAMFELIYSCGLRVSEASNMVLSDLHFLDNLIKVDGKGSKERVIPFGDVARKKLEKYLKKARPHLLGGGGCDNVFIGKTGKKLSRMRIWEEFRNLELSSGVIGKVHTLRHSFATHLLGGGANLRVVQELLGHADLATTQIYTHVNDQNIHDIHDKFFRGHKQKKGGEDEEPNERDGGGKGDCGGGTGGNDCNDANSLSTVKQVNREDAKARRRS